MGEKSFKYAWLVSSCGWITNKLKLCSVSVPCGSSGREQYILHVGTYMLVGDVLKPLLACILVQTSLPMCVPLKAQSFKFEVLKHIRYREKHIFTEN